MLALTGFVVFNIAFGTAFILGVGFIPEPMRRQFMIVLLAFEFGCYWQGGLGILLYPCTAVGLISAVVGFRWYPIIGAGWVVHIILELMHHLAGLPLVPSISLSSLGCAIFDIDIAMWFFVGAPDVWAAHKRSRAAWSG